MKREEEPKEGKRELKKLECNSDTKEETKI